MVNGLKTVVFQTIALTKRRGTIAQVIIAINCSLVVFIVGFVGTYHCSPPDAKDDFSRVTPAIKWPARHVK